MAWNDEILDRLSKGMCTAGNDQMEASFEIKRLRRALTKIMNSGSYEHRTTLAHWAKDALNGDPFE